MSDRDRRWIATIRWHNSMWTMGAFLTEGEAWNVAGLLVEALATKHPSETGEVVGVEPDWRHGPGSAP